MEREINYYKIDYKDFGHKNSQMVELIRKMSRDYGFWYGGRCCTIKDQNMTEFAKRKFEKNRHKFVLYRFENTDTYYLVQYCNNFIKIFYCYNGRQRTIIKNFRDAFEQGKKERLERDYDTIKEIQR